MGRYWLMVFVYSLMMFGLFSACGDPPESKEVVADASTPTDASSPTETTPTETSGPAWGSSDDVTQAETIWQDVKDVYATWAKFPGKEGDDKGFVDSAVPHGEKYARIFVSNKDNLEADGSIIIKENHNEKNDTIDSITIMKKIAGFDPENKDWFWIKLSATGEVLKNPAGVPLAGAVGKGANAACIGCHKQSADYIRSNGD